MSRPHVSENEIFSSEQSEFDDLVKSLTLNETDLKVLIDLDPLKSKDFVGNLSNSSEKPNLMLDFEVDQNVNTLNTESDAISIGTEKENTNNPDLLEHLDTNIMKERNTIKVPLTSSSDPENLSLTLNEDSVECFYDTSDAVNIPNENQKDQRENLSSISLSFQSTNEGEFTEVSNDNTLVVETYPNSSDFNNQDISNPCSGTFVFFVYFHRLRNYMIILLI
jgi:hypothetical protein